MASTFSPLLQLELIGIGDQNNTWGTTTNTNLGTLIEEAIAGSATVDVTSGNVTLSVFEGSTDQARQAVIRVIGTPGVVRNIIAPAHSKLYVISNGSNADVVIKTTTSTGLTVNQGQVFLAYYDTIVNDFIYISRTASVGTVARTLVLRDANGDIGSRYIFADGFIGDIAGNLVSPTATAFTQPAVTNNTTIATTAFVKTAVTTATGSLGTISTQNANAVAITGGTITGSYGLNAATATNLSGGSVSATTGTFSGSVSVSTDNTTGGGILIGDDGDIVDLNNGYCSMRFSNGVLIYSANRGGSPVITLGQNGYVFANGLIGQWNGTTPNVGATYWDASASRYPGNPGTGSSIPGSYFGQPGTWLVLNSDYVNAAMYFMIRTS